MSDDDFDDLLTSDTEWWANFAAALEVLRDWSTGQLEFWPVDDFVAEKRYVSCPRRGTHQKLTECWACWCDWAYGYAAAVELLAPGADG